MHYPTLPSEVLPELRLLTRERAQALLEQLDLWMAARNREVNPTVQGTGRKRAMVGIYYFEEDFSEEDQA